LIHRNETTFLIPAGWHYTRKNVFEKSGFDRQKQDEKRESQEIGFPFLVFGSNWLLLLFSDFI
jgi:hypothetical protein